MINNQGQNFSKLGLGLLLGLTITFFSYLGVFEGLQGLGLVIGRNLTASFQESFTHIDDGFGLITSLQQIRLENMELKSENAELSQRVAELEDQEQTLEEVLKQSKIKLPESQEFYLSEIIQFSESPIPGTFYIYIGLEDITVGDFVVSGNVIIGEISETVERYARVQLTSVTGTSYPVRVGNTLGTLEGRGGNQLSVARVDSDSKVQVGDKVSLAKADGPEPMGFILGEVSSVEGLAADATKIISVSVPVDISGLTHVFVIPNHD